MAEFTPTAAANALLRPAIHAFELAMDPLVKAWAKQKWGERQEAGWRFPQWAWRIAYECIGSDMRPFFDPAKLLDAFTLGEVVQNHIVEFVQASLPTFSDAQREQYRNAVHHVGFMRNALAHSPEPSAAECVQGVDAVLAVLQAHGAGEAAQVARLTELRHRLQRIAATATGAAQPLDVSAEELRMVVLESAMQHFAASVGYEAHHRYQPPEKAPPLPLSVAGKYDKRKSICTLLGKYHPELKGWDKYKGWFKLPATAPARQAVDVIKDTRHALNHGRHDYAEARVAAEVGHLLAIHAGLGLRTDRLQAISDALAAAAAAGTPPALELTAAEGPGQTVVEGTRIPVPSGSDPRTYLVGRDSLVADVAARLTGAAWSREVLHGESGAGKTVAAWRICDEVRARGALPWQVLMHGSSVLTLRAELARFARMHVAGLAEDAEEEAVVEAARQALASGWLLLVDDVGPDLEGVLELLPTRPDGSPAGHVLLTMTGQRSSWPEHVSATLVDQLSLDEAVDLLRKGDRGKRVEEQVLATESVGVRSFVEEVLSTKDETEAVLVLPLDVALLKSALLAAQEKASREKLDKLAEAAAVVARWRTEPMSSLEAAETRDPQRRSMRRRHGGVRELIHRLEERCAGELRLLEAARALLAMASVLATTVPRQMFTADGRSVIPEGSEGLPAEVALFRDEELFRAAVDVLAGVGLVEVLPGGGLRMHQLVQRSARWVLLQRAGGECVACSLRVWAILRREIKERFVAKADEHGHRPTLEALAPSVNVLYELQHEGQHGHVLAPVTRADLADGLGRWHQQLGGRAQWARAEGLLRHALEARLEVLGDRHAQALTSMNNLAMLLHAMGEHTEARRLMEEALNAKREELGPRDPGTLTSINNLALLLHAMGERKEARPLYEEALKARREELGPRHPRTLDSIDNLALLLQDMGEYEKARPLMEKALEGHRKELGPRHPDTLTSIINFAGLLHGMGEDKKARPLMEEALKLSREVLGPHHPNTLGSINNFAGLLHGMGEYKKARPLMEEALKLSRENLGPCHPRTLTSIGNFAEQLRAMGEYKKARPLMEEALKLSREVLGPRHPNTLASINNLAELLRAMGEYEKARPLMEEALKLSREVLGPRHPNTLGSINNFAGLLKDMGEHKEARSLYEQALKGCREALGDRHPSTLTIAKNLAILNQQLQAARPKQKPNEPCACGSGKKHKKCCGACR